MDKTLLKHVKNSDSREPPQGTPRAPLGPDTIWGLPTYLDQRDAKKALIPGVGTQETPSSGLVVAVIQERISH